MFLQSFTLQAYIKTLNRFSRSENNIGFVLILVRDSIEK